MIDEQARCACDGRPRRTDGGDEGEGDDVSGNSTVAAAARAEAAPRRAAWLGLFACVALDRASGHAGAGRRGGSS